MREEKIKKCVDYIINNLDPIAAFDNEVLNWVEDNWEDEYESEYESYIETGRGEAENAVFEEFITECESNKIIIDSTYEEREKIMELLSDETGINFL